MVSDYLGIEIELAMLKLAALKEWISLAFIIFCIMPDWCLRWVGLYSGLMFSSVFPALTIDRIKLMACTFLNLISHSI